MDDSLTIKERLIAASGASLVAAVVTNPLEVLKVQLLPSQATLNIWKGVRCALHRHKDATINCITDRRFVCVCRHAYKQQLLRQAHASTLKWQLRRALQRLCLVQGHVLQ